jgi:hypothetical protein
MNPQCLGQRVVDRNVGSRNSCHNACSAWASLKWADGASGWHNPCFGCATATSGASGAAWDVEASASCAGHCDITQPSSHITAPLVHARGLTWVAPSIGPTRGEHRDQQRPPPHRGPPWAGFQDEPARALGKGHGGPVPAMSPLPHLLAAASWPRP